MCFALLICNGIANVKGFI